MPRLPIWSRIAARRMAARASQAARQRRYAAAADLYAEALRLKPGVAGRHVQAGHMFKEAGDYPQAELHYEAAAALRPGDPDLALQRGHFYSLAGRADEAEAAYAHALALDPRWEDPRREIERLRSATFRLPDLGGEAMIDDGRVLDPAPDALRASAGNRLLPEYLASPDGKAPAPDAELLDIRRLGRRDRSPWGVLRTLRGIEAVHGHCLSRDPIDEVQILLNGRLVRREPVSVHDVPGATGGLRKAVFNLWIDFSDHVPGRYHIEIRLRGDQGAAGGRFAFREHVVIAPPLPAPALPGSEAWVPPIDPGDPRPLDAQIEARPSVVRRIGGRLIAPPRTILVLRTDQLGDLVISVPALRRLREIAPGARIVGLLTAANAELARSLALFDEVIVADFPDVAEERRRTMAAAEQERLRETLSGYAFDVAIDLAPAEISRALLLLAGARLTMGFGDEISPFLDAGFDLDLRDEYGHAGILPSSVKTLAMIEALGAMIRAADDPVRRTDLDPGRLARFGIAAGEPFAVLHTGARIAFSRWPHYAALARRLIDECDLKVVLLGEEAEVAGPLRGEPRFLATAERLPFDDLDALLSFCTVFVGNDSGPKHLASLRGAAVVSVHAARANWGEWGQASGAIVTRQVPCAACHIYHDAEDCGRGWTCVTRITVDEVYDAVVAEISAAAR